MNTTDYLLCHGWKLVRKVNGYSPALGNRTNWQAWEHLDHQPSRRGFFNKGEAVAHQRHVDSGLPCYCIRREDSTHD